MLSRTARGLALAAALLVPALALAQKKSASEYTVEEFFRRAEYQNMQLSPNGELLAATIPFKGRANLVVIDLNKRTRNLITSFESQDVGAFYWVNNSRLCMRVAETQDVSGAFNYRGTYCVDHDGQNLRDFTNFGAAFNRIYSFDNESPEMIVAFGERSRDSADAFPIDTRNRKKELLTRDTPGDVSRWVFDHKGVARVAVSDPERKDKSALAKRIVWYRDNAESKWEKLAEWDTVAGRSIGTAISPVAFDYDNTTLYVTANPGRDRFAIYKYATQARKLGELMFEDPLVDVTAGLVFDSKQKKLVGIRYHSGMAVTRWLDPERDALQKSIDATFPNAENTIAFPRDNRDRALIFTVSDVNPGAYYLYDAKRKGIEFLAKQREWIDPALMAQRKFITYKARDGRTIPAYITIPRGIDPKNLPLVVNVHGGPAVRGFEWVNWGRWPEAQFFAPRGYIVLEPEPRGSTGFGFDHWKSGWKRWGGTAQDDITDGALYLAREGMVDKNRMCITGGSYGGYASAEAVVKDPDLWRCANPFVAVTDLFLLQGVTWSDISENSDYLETDFMRVVGNPRSDKEMMDIASPARHADRVKAPVMLTMGGADVRVPEIHGAEFYKALKAAGAKVDYKVYNGEGHGFNKQENVVDFYKRVEAFFAENLKK